MNKIIKKLDKIQDFIGRQSSLILLPLIIIVVYSSFMRYVFNRAPDWGFEISVFLFGIYSIISGAYVLKEDGHVRVDILPSMLGDRGNKIISIISNLLVLLVSLVLMYMGSKTAIQSTKILERSIHQSTFNPQIWWFRWMIPLAAALLAVQSIVNLLKNLKLGRIEK